MKQIRIPAVFMRGGTSNAVVFNAKDLPRERALWDEIFLAAIGSPDPYGRQLDGMGGGISSLSKVCVVGPSSRPDADIDYTFAQVSVKEAKVDYSGNCGNMSSAMGPFAVDEGLVKASGKGSARAHPQYQHAKNHLVALRARRRARRGRRRARDSRRRRHRCAGAARVSRTGRRNDREASADRPRARRARGAGPRQIHGVDGRCRECVLFRARRRARHHRHGNARSARCEHRAARAARRDPHRGFGRDGHRAHARRGEGQARRAFHRFRVRGRRMRSRSPASASKRRTSISPAA